MIGHYLLTLTPEQEDRVLTTTFEPVWTDVRQELGLPSHAPGIDPRCGCLTMTVEGTLRPNWDTYGQRGHPGFVYEDTCLRFGFERINAAIRNRILSNRANRVLRHAPQLEAV